MKEDSRTRRLRRMKREELRLRFPGVEPPPADTVWRRFFSGCSPRYPQSLLRVLENGAFEWVEQEFYAEVLYHYWAENGFADGPPRDPALLRALGLPPSAGEEDIKRRFRALAQRLHPDHGGSADDFRRVLEAYRALTKTIGTF